MKFFRTTNKRIRIALLCVLTTAAFVVPTDAQTTISQNIPTTHRISAETPVVKTNTEHKRTLVQPTTEHQTQHHHEEKRHVRHKSEYEVQHTYTYSFLLTPFVHISNKLLAFLRYGKIHSLTYA